MSATTAGWFSAESAASATDGDVPSATVGKIAAGSCTIDGGVLSTTGFSKNDLVLTLADGSDTNFDTSTCKFIGSKDITKYPYYFKVKGSTPAVSGSTTATVTAITDAHTAGYIPAKATSNFRNA